MLPLMLWFEISRRKWDKERFDDGGPRTTGHQQDDMGKECGVPKHPPPHPKNRGMFRPHRFHSVDATRRTWSSSTIGAGYGHYELHTETCCSHSKTASERDLARYVGLCIVCRTLLLLLLLWEPTTEIYRICPSSSSSHVPCLFFACCG